MKKMIPMERNEIFSLFSKIDGLLQSQGKNISVTALGGVALILQRIIDRATADIDIAPTSDAFTFQETCHDIGIQVDIITVASTVDLVHAPTLNIYQGKALTIRSITPYDLIKLKLERFRKQDPEDIYALLEKTKLSYEKFKSLVQDMVIDYIGNRREVLISALLVVERLFPDNTSDFQQLLNSP